MEAMTGAEGHMVAPELPSARMQCPRPWDTWWRRSPPLQSGVIQSYSLRDRCVDEHTAPCFDLELVCKVSGLQNTEES
jgi:hypothetical protein